MLLWGSLFPVVKLGFKAYDVVSVGDILLFAGIRFTICGAIISAFSYVKDKNSFSGAKYSIMPILASGLFAIILHYAFTYIGLKYTDSSKTAILKQLGALFYVCFSVVFFKDDRLTLRKLVGVVLGFLGIIAVNITGTSFKFHIGDALIIAASFCTVFSNVISKKVFEKVNPVASTGISQLFGGIVLLIVGYILGGSVSFRANSDILIMIYICIASCISYCIWFTVVKKGQLSKLFIIKFAEPVFASLIGAYLLGENILKPEYIIGFILIAFGIYISSTVKKQIQ